MSEKAFYDSIFQVFKLKIIYLLPMPGTYYENET